MSDDYWKIKLVAPRARELRKRGDGLVHVVFPNRPVAKYGIEEARDLMYSCDDAEPLSARDQRLFEREGVAPELWWQILRGRRNLQGEATLQTFEGVPVKNFEIKLSRSKNVQVSFDIQPEAPITMNLSMTLQADEVRDLLKIVQR